MHWYFMCYQERQKFSQLVLCDIWVDHNIFSLLWNLFHFFPSLKKLPNVKCFAMLMIGCNVFGTKQTKYVTGVLLLLLHFVSQFLKIPYGVLDQPTPTSKWNKMLWFYACEKLASLNFNYCSFAHSIKLLKNNNVDKFNQFKISKTRWPSPYIRKASGLQVDNPFLEWCLFWGIGWKQYLCALFVFYLYLFVFYYHLTYYFWKQLIIRIGCNHFMQQSEQ